MLKRSLSIVLLLGLFAGFALAEGKVEGDKQEPKVPSLNELSEIIRPMIAPLDLSDTQQRKVDGIMTDVAWNATLDAYESRHGSEIYIAAQKQVPEIMPTIMMPRMMAYNMQKTMKERMARRAGPPTPEEIKAIRSAMQQRMRAKLAPNIMTNVRKLADSRIEELMIDQKVLVRVLAEAIAASALSTKQKEDFNGILTKAGYPEELVHGPDPILMQRVRQMLEELADKVVADLKKEDEAAKESN